MQTNPKPLDPADLINSEWRTHSKLLTCAVMLADDYLVELTREKKINDEPRVFTIILALRAITNRLTSTEHELLRRDSHMQTCLDHIIKNLKLGAEQL